MAICGRSPGILIGNCVRMGVCNFPYEELAVVKAVYSVVGKSVGGL
jgi:hypothetical protein